MQGKKTHEQQLRILERKPDDPRHTGQSLGGGRAVPKARAAVRHSEWPVSRGGMNQESDHNKHNDPGQSGHKPQQPAAAQQKQSRG